jgi:hypothetical protein
LSKENGILKNIVTEIRDCWTISALLVFIRVEHIRKQFERNSKYKISFEIEFKAIILSSLCAIRNFTIHNFTNIIVGHRRNQVMLWVKRMAIAALK